MQCPFDMALYNSLISLSNDHMTCGCGMLYFMVAGMLSTLGVDAGQKQRQTHFPYLSC